MLREYEMRGLSAEHGPTRPTRPSKYHCIFIISLSPFKTEKDTYLIIFVDNYSLQIRVNEM